MQAMEKTKNCGFFLEEVIASLGIRFGLPSIAARSNSVFGNGCSLGGILRRDSYGIFLLLQHYLCHPTAAKGLSAPCGVLVSRGVRRGRWKDHKLERMQLQYMGAWLNLILASYSKAVRSLLFEQA